MPLEIVTIPCLADNYDYLIHDTASGATALVDATDAAPILAELSRRGWNLSEIWLTHHHNDHIDATEELRAATGATVLGAGADAHRLPPLDRAVAGGDSFTFANARVEVLDVPGHTVGHITFHIPDAKALFSADSLMALGCGRLFEGTPAQMWDSLNRMAALPEDTLVYSGHEYTASNAKFALTIEPDNAELISRVAAIDAARAAGKPTVPALLSEEKATNPFLRAHLPHIKAALHMNAASDDAVFAEIRSRKDNF
ncbi:MAG: hydroxyacylglutathione hydrolase [Paracoccaceae bacterium]